MKLYGADNRELMTISEIAREALEQYMK